MSLPDVAMVFAAGFGTRMGTLTRDVPKPLIKAGGRSLLDHALERLSTVPRIVVNTHYHADQVAAAVAGRGNVHVSHEPEILETGGGMRAALPHLAERALTVNPDAIWAHGAEPLAALQRHWRPEMEALLVLVPVAQARAYTRAGDFDLADDGQLIRRGQASHAPYVYSGWQIMRTDRLTAFSGAFSLNLVWNEIAAAGGLYGVVCDAPWVDVGTAEGLALAEDLLREGI